MGIVLFMSSRAVSQFRTGDREIDIILQYREDERETLDQLKQVPVRQAGVALPLAAVADFDRVAGADLAGARGDSARVATAAAEAALRMLRAD